jgi:hypothetical protein
MFSRYAYPVLFSVAGLLIFILPLTSSHKTATEINSEKDFTGKNTFTFDSDHLKMDKNAALNVEVAHSSDLFYLNLWMGQGREHRITFVLRGEEIKETAYELDQPSTRYLSLLYHGKDCTYSSDDYYTGMLMIHKYDTAQKIIAGSFEFMAYSDECEELIRVNNGTFDATYVTP